MKKAQQYGLRAVALFILACWPAGCGEAPMAPGSSGSGSPGTGAKLASYPTAPNPEVMVLEEAGNVAFVATSGESLETQASLASVDPTGRPERSIESVGEIDGSKGGSLVCGRFVLTVPPGAFDGVATVTMTAPDSTVMLCDLEIAPAALNRFEAPVELQLYTHNLSVEESDLTILWWDQDSYSWMDMRAIPDSNSRTITARLGHFSRYAGGKAGW